MKNKYLYFGIIVLITITSFVLSGCKSTPSIPKLGQNISEGNFYGRVIISDKGSLSVEITSFLPAVTGGSIEIPSQIRGLTVTSIRPGVFSGKSLENVTIPEGITTIGKQAFAYNKLTSVIIPISVTEIGDQAFIENQLTNVTISNHVTLGEQVFARNPKLVNPPLSLEEQQRVNIRNQEAQARQAEQERLANLYRQAGNNFGNLRNASMGARQVYGSEVYTQRYDFGDGNYIYVTTNHHGIQSTKTGTYRVNGDTVIFLSSGGEYSFGTIIGTTLSIDGKVFR